MAEGDDLHCSQFAIARAWARALCDLIYNSERSDREYRADLKTIALKCRRSSIRVKMNRWIRGQSKIGTRCFRSPGDMPPLNGQAIQSGGLPVPRGTSTTSQPRRFMKRCSTAGRAIMTSNLCSASASLVYRVETSSPIRRFPRVAPPERRYGDRRYSRKNVESTIRHPSNSREKPNPLLRITIGVIGKVAASGRSRLGRSTVNASVRPLLRERQIWGIHTGSGVGFCVICPANLTAGNRCGNETRDGLYG